MFGEIQADPTLGQDEPQQAIDADADDVNSSWPEDPALMAYELEITYGGYKPGEALGGLEDLDALDVTAAEGRMCVTADGRRAYRCKRCGLELKVGHICPALVERSLEAQTVPIDQAGQAIVGSGERVVTVRSYKSGSHPSSGTELCRNQL